MSSLWWSVNLLFRILCLTTGLKWSGYVAFSSCFYILIWMQKYVMGRLCYLQLYKYFGNWMHVIIQKLKFTSSRTRNQRWIFHGYILIFRNEHHSLNSSIDPSQKIMSGSDIKWSSRKTRKDCMFTSIAVNKHTDAITKATNSTWHNQWVNFIASPPYSWLPSILPLLIYSNIVIYTHSCF